MLRLQSLAFVTLIVSSALFLIPAGALAQEMGSGLEDESTAYEGIPVGNGLLRPSFEALIEYDDNIFLTSTDTVDDLVYVARPKLEFELPFKQSSLKLGAMLQYKDFKDHEQDEPLSPMATFDLMLRFSSGLSLQVADRAISGVLEVDEIDPDHEVVFGQERFLKNAGTIAVRYDWDTRNGIGLSATGETLSFDEPNDLFYDYTNLGAGVNYFHKLHPLLEINVSAQYRDLSHDVDYQFRDATGGDLWVGFKGELAKTLSGTLRVGAESLSYDDNTLSDEGFQSVIAELKLVKQFPANAALTVILHRAANQSNYAPDVNYYTATRGGLEYSQRYHKLFFTLGGSFQGNAYPTESLFYQAEARDDQLIIARVGVGYYFLRTLSLKANYRFEDRQSNIDEFDFKSNAYLLDLRFGF